MSQLLPAVAAFTTVLLTVTPSAPAQGPTAARELLRSHQYAAALAAADQQLQRSPGDPEAHFTQGLALQGLHRTSDALAALRQTLSLDPSFLPAAEAGAQIAYATHDASAATFLDAVLRLEPANTTAHAMHGVLALEAGDCPAALADSAAAPQLRSADPSTTRRLTVCEAQGAANAGDLDHAAFLLASLSPDPAVTRDLAAIRLQQHQPTAAIALLAPSRATLSAADLDLLGNAYASDEKLPDAVQAYRDAIARDPHDDRAYLDLVTLSMEHQSPEVALSVLQTGLSLNNNNTRLLVTRGTIYAQLGKDALAQQDFEAADRLNPKSTFGTLGLGVLLREQSNLDQAQLLLEQKLKADPDDPVLSFMLADVLIRKGADPGDPGFARALTLLHTSIRKQPDLAPAHALLGKLEVKQDRPEAAIPELEHAIRLQPNDRTALNQLIAAYRRLGRTSDAERVSAQLAASVAAERADEVEKNRDHLTLAEPVQAPSASELPPRTAPAVVQR